MNKLYLFLTTIPLCVSSTLFADTIKIAMHNGGFTVDGFNSQPDGTLVSAGTNGSDTWNNIQNNGGSGLSFTGFALSLEDGTASGATASASTGFAGFNNNGWGSGTDDSVMMEGWYGFRTTENMTISSLPSVFTTNGYNVTIYGDSDVTSRTMNYTIAGSTKTIIDSGTFSGTFTEGSNFVTFTGLTSSNFTITGNDADTAGRSAINGLVITAIPEPSSTALLLGLGGLALILRRRR